MKKLNSVTGIKKGDVVVIAILVLLCIFWFFVSFAKHDDKAQAMVYVSGELVYSVALDEINEPVQKEFNGVNLLFEKDGISFVSSSCSNQLCVKSAKLTHIGSTMACVPNKVVVSIAKTNNSFDIVSY